jgi:hypothetical protein
MEPEGNSLDVVTMSAERFHSCISRGILGAKQLACFRGCSGEEIIHVLAAHWSGDVTVTRDRIYSWEFSWRVHVTLVKRHVRLSAIQSDVYARDLSYLLLVLHVCLFTDAWKATESVSNKKLSCSC